MVEIVGEPGIGKSRLVSELVSRAEDILVLTAAADRSGLFTPYGAARGLLSRALGIAGVRDLGRGRHPGPRTGAPAGSGADPPRLPLLGAVLDLDLADDEGLVGALEEQFRTEAVHELVVDLLATNGTPPRRCCSSRTPTSSTRPARASSVGSRRSPTGARGWS